MKCPKCGKDLPDNAANCKKCGTVFKENKGNAEMEAYLKKEKEKAAKKELKNKKTVNKGLIAGIVIAVVIIGAALALLFHFDMIGSRNPNRFVEKGPLDIEYTFVIDDEDEVVMHFGDVAISYDEYEFFYRQSYSTVRNNAQLSFRDFVSKKLGSEYDQNKDYQSQYYDEFLAENTDVFDYTKPIDAQLNMTKDAQTGETITWKEYINDDAINSMLNYRVKYELALEMGLELTDDVKIQVYDHIEGLRTAVKQGGYPNLNEYLKNLFGDACDEEFFKNELIREYMATKYETEINLRLINEYSDADIRAIYEKEYKEYDFIDLYLYEVKGDNSKAVADKIASEATDLDAFTRSINNNVSAEANKESLPAVPKYYVDNNYSAELGEWAFDRARVKNDVGVFKTEEGYIVGLVYVPVYSKENCVSYREIVMKKADENGAALSAEELETLKTNVDETYEQWEDGDANGDTFAYYAMTQSQGETASSGGLRSGVSKIEMAEGPVKEWLISSERKAGDTTVIETDDAYTILYFVNGYGDYWNYSIRATKANEAATQKIESAKKDAYAVSYDKEQLCEAEEIIIDDISELYLGITQK